MHKINRNVGFSKARFVLRRQTVSDPFRVQKHFLGAGVLRVNITTLLVWTAERYSVRSTPDHFRQMVISYHDDWYNVKYNFSKINYLAQTKIILKLFTSHHSVDVLKSRVATPTKPHNSAVAAECNG